MERRIGFMKDMSSALRYGPNWFQFTSIQNTNEEKLISVCFVLLFCLACNTVPVNWYRCVTKGLIYFTLNGCSTKGLVKKF